MNVDPLAGKLVAADMLIDLTKLEREYYTRKPDFDDPHQLVNFGTSGHRGTPFEGTFTEEHILAITQAICDYRNSQRITGPVFLGKDTHGISAAAQCTALEVLAANGIETFIQEEDGFTPTPALSLAILAHNQGRRNGYADGIGITPSHNPPADGGFKYNPPNGGPADTEVTEWIQSRANELLLARNRDTKRTAFEQAARAATTHRYDFLTPYVEGLGSVLDMEAIRGADVKIGVDPLGGASVNYWGAIAQRYRLNLTVVNSRVDPTFSFMTVDRDGKVRMDCSSPFAMAGLLSLKDQFEVAFACDPDADRHGIVSPTAGLMNPNHYLAVAINYLLRNRPQWPATAAVGKTVVSSGLIDRVVVRLGRRLFEVPVGFKHFTAGLYDGSLCFGGEESAGASFLRCDGSVWCTDKDGLLLGLLAAEIVAHIGTLAHQYQTLSDKLGTPFYTRIDMPCTPEEKAGFRKLTPESVQGRELAGESILAKLVNAPGNNEPIGGLKVVTQNGWFAARPSGTENVYKLYAESFRSQGHLDAIIDEARQILSLSLSAIAPNIKWQR